MKMIAGMSFRLGLLLGAGLLATAFAGGARADEIHVKMLDKSSSGPLAFDPGFVRAKPGDTIVFEPAQQGGHSSVSLLVPPGAQPWTGAVDKETRVRLDTQGVYLYACAAHQMMGMVGVIQVGKPVNLDDAKKAAKSEARKFVLNRDRFDQELAQLR